KDFAKHEISLLDGRNRLDAIELNYAGDPEGLNQALNDALWIDRNQKGCAVLLGSAEVEDPWAFVISANLKRRHLTADDRKRITEALLKARPERSDRATAKIAKVSDKTVAAVRRDLEGRAEIPHVGARTDTAGRQQPANKPPVISKEAQLRA